MDGHGTPLPSLSKALAVIGAVVDSTWSRIMELVGKDL